MKKYLILFTSLTLLLASACSKRHKLDKLHYYQDFESLKGWMPGVQISDEVQGHSGVYTVVTSKDNPYSLTLQLSPADLGSKTVKKFKASAWCNLKSANCAGGLCVQIVNEAGENKMWVSTNVKDVVKGIDTWTKVTAYGDITPDMLDPKNRIKFFLWNTASDKIYADDFELEFVQ